MRRRKKGLNWRRAVHVLIGLILLAGAGVAVGLILLFYQGGALPTASMETLAPAQVQAAEEKVRSLEETAERLAEAVKAHRPTPFTLRVRDAELNTYFAVHPEALRALNPDLRWAEFEFGTGGTVSFRGLGTYQGREVLLQVKGNVSLDPNQGPSFTLQEGRLGALPLPGGLRRKLAAEINRSLSREFKKLPPELRIESLSTEAGELTVQGRVTAEAG